MAADVVLDEASCRDQVEAIKARVKKSRPDASVDFIEKAYQVALAAHHGQVRASGRPYIEHPVAVAAILAEMELDATSIAAALLHDVVEDTGVPLSDIEENFGAETALLVDGVTKLGRIKYESRVEAQAENLRKMFLAMAKDIRVILIRLADRLHNMRTLEYLRPEKRERVARETLEIYAPIAHRLGISTIQWELEDLALKYLEPERYRELARQIPQQRRERERYTNEVIDELRKHLAELGIKADIQGRAKHLYSIYRKVYMRGRDLSEIYDLIAVRVIVDSLRDCYAVLGAVHTMWRPLPGRFKDYIATPKSNMYQSLHTTVIGPRGAPFEVQIRTWDMHRTAEYGIAAHWRYKEGGRSDPNLDAKLTWLREILEWQSDLKDAGEFMDSLKLDVFADEVFVFTPKGDIIALPAGATPIDFAYRIHTEVGHRCVGAKINGKIVPLETKLANGDIVEILTNNQSAGPSSDWLKIVKTSTAKNRIRQFLKRQRREENLARGKEIIERELKAFRLTFQDVWVDQWVAEVAEKYQISDPEELLVAIGYGGISGPQVASRLRDVYRREVGETDVYDIEELVRHSKVKPASSTEGVHVKGIDNVLVRLSRCCNPVPGDPIVGYITRGRGVSIHHRNCANLRHLIQAEGPARAVEVSWDRMEVAQYPVKVMIQALDRPGLLSDVARAVAETRTNIQLARARSCRDGRAEIDLIMEIKSLEHFEFLRRRIESIRDILSVERVHPQQ
ncbi:MAG TPA: bifunctional (p)ppGpp synthetase/guanosine-3',5'-bis(diphosphate) 3'-pyrophosphohydrolase [Sphingobacteriaceae bacterium]|nr:bifunctional (p)ppGpp synthetase/guanosine-3',5'-bis(diphosphate) 3'-pyrophosphohydrolase [Sphingobacteriaceae bacterium]